MKRGAGGSEEAVCNGSQRSDVAETIVAESGVLDAAELVVLNGDAGLFVDSIAQAALSGLVHGLDFPSERKAPIEQHRRPEGLTRPHLVGPHHIRCWQAGERRCSLN